MVFLDENSPSSLSSDDNMFVAALSNFSASRDVVDQLEVNCDREVMNLLLPLEVQKVRSFLELRTAALCFSLDLETL